MLIYWFLPMILFLGTVTSYEDIRFGKIKNKWILTTIIYCIMVNTSLYLMYYTDGVYVTKLIINSITSLFVGFIIWYANLWTAGDAKLFFSYSILLPLDIYGFYNFDYFPSGIILIFTFIPLTTYFMISALIKTKNKVKLKYLLYALKKEQMAKFFLFIFATTWLFNIIIDGLKIKGNIIFTSLLAFLVFLAIDRLFNITIIIFLIFLSIARFIFDKNIFLPKTWLNLFYLLVLFLIFRLFLLTLTSGIFSKNVKLRELKSGMIPSEVIYKDGRIYKKRKIRNYGLIGALYSRAMNNRYLYTIRAEGLSNRDIAILKKLEPKLPYQSLRIQQTISFAPFLFLGVVITLIVNYLYYYLFIF